VKRKKLMKKILASAVLCLLFCSWAFGVSAFVPYDTYTYSTRTGSVEALYSPTAYYPDFVIDKSLIGIPLVTPTCICFDKEGNMYITDNSANRLIVLNPDFSLKANLDTFETEDGMFEFLGGPEGVFVTDDMEIYLCDTKQKRILVLDQKYNIIRKYENIKPVGVENDEDYSFMPTRIVVDSSKNMYVLVQNEYQGIMQIDQNGKFISFLGSNKVTYDPITKLWKKIMTKEQKKQLIQFLPVEYTNLTMDHEGFIYTASKADNSSPIKRLNLAGKDVLIRNGYVDMVGDVKTSKTTEKVESLIAGVDSDENGQVYALDSNGGRIFVYNSEGFLLYAFGSIGNQIGSFITPSDIKVNNDLIFVADQGTARITVFRRTEYADLVTKANDLYYKGQYEESVNLWKQVIERNANFELAYAQIGKVYLRENRYKEAMEYFKLGNFRGDKITNTTGYNKAFIEYRRIQASKLLGPFVIVIVVLYIGYSFYKSRRKRTGKAANLQR